jgi:hypothetical protein
VGIEEFVIGTHPTDEAPKPPDGSVGPDRRSVIDEGGPGVPQAALNPQQGKFELEMLDVIALQLPDQINDGVFTAESIARQIELPVSSPCLIHLRIASS